MTNRNHDLGSKCLHSGASLMAAPREYAHDIFGRHVCTGLMFKNRAFSHKAAGPLAVVDGLNLVAEVAKAAFVLPAYGGRASICGAVAGHAAVSCCTSLAITANSVRTRWRLLCLSSRPLRISETNL